MKRHAGRVLCALLAASGVSFTSAGARAFQSPARYLEAPETGGGGGRFFTGAPSDRYTCKVCHTRGESLDVQVRGLPVHGYVPGQSYRIVVDWADTLKSVAFNIEMTDSAGRAAGVFTVPAIDQLSPADLCPATGVPAVVATPAGQGQGMMMARTLALLSECGSHQATFDWTAPTPGTDAQSVQIGSEVWFSGSLVSADTDGTVIGDTVVDFSRVMGLRQRSSPDSTDIKGGCQLTRGPSSRHAPALVLSAALGLVARNRRRRGARR